jgi:hypothetical protein
MNNEAHELNPEWGCMFIEMRNEEKASNIQFFTIK